MDMYLVDSKGRVGAVRCFNMDGTVYVQFGPDGPFEDIHESDIFKYISKEEFYELTNNS